MIFKLFATARDSFFEKVGSPTEQVFSSLEWLLNPKNIYKVIIIPGYGFICLLPAFLKWLHQLIIISTNSHYLFHRLMFNWCSIDQMLFYFCFIQPGEQVL